MVVYVTTNSFIACVTSKAFMLYLITFLCLLYYFRYVLKFDSCYSSPISKLRNRIERIQFKMTMNVDLITIEIEELIQIEECLDTITNFASNKEYSIRQNESRKEITAIRCLFTRLIGTYTEAHKLVVNPNLVEDDELDNTMKHNTSYLIEKEMFRLDGYLLDDETIYCEHIEFTANKLRNVIDHLTKLTIL